MYNITNSIYFTSNNLFYYSNICIYDKIYYQYNLCNEANKSSPKQRQVAESSLSIVTTRELIVGNENTLSFIATLLILIFLFSNSSIFMLIPETFAIHLYQP